MAYYYNLATFVQRPVCVADFLVLWIFCAMTTVC